MGWPRDGWPPNTEGVRTFGQDFIWEEPLFWTPEKDETGRWPRPPCPRRQLPAGWPPEMADLYPFPVEIPAVLSGWHLVGAQWVRVDPMGRTRAQGFTDHRRALAHKSGSYRLFLEQIGGKPLRYSAQHFIAVPADEGLTWERRLQSSYADTPVEALKLVDQELLHQGWRLLGALDLSYLPSKLTPRCT